MVSPSGWNSPDESGPCFRRIPVVPRRGEITQLHAQQFGVRKIARQLERATSTIPRELRRNAATRGGKLQYPARVAQWKAERATHRPKVAKVTLNDRRRAYVQERLAGTVLDARGKRLPGPASALERASPSPALRSPLGQ